MTYSIPRPEHPLPQWQRANWRNLNGEWEFEFDFGKSALDRGVISKERLERTITVPFCPESKLSGIGYTDFIPAACYRRSFTLTKEECTSRVVLHFGAVDYDTRVFVNGKEIGRHIGGYTSFCFDVTGAVREGENTLFLYVEDDVRSGKQPGGKQSARYFSHGCDYTRTTGIWQTVWLEFTPHTYIKTAKYYPDIENKCLTIVAEVKGSGILQATASYEGRLMANLWANACGTVVLQLPLAELHLWEAGKGRLYDLTLSFGEDTVSSYFGMRSTCYEGKKWLLNGKSIFMRMVLDQGFYQGGIYTAPTEEALKKDIELSLAAGFNGARLHEKVFEARFLYHADKMGYLVFGEYPNWRLNHHLPEAAAIYMNEWQEAVERDFNSPAVIGWCPLNESWGYWEQQASNRLISSVYYLTKRLDPTRPCIDISGNFHVTPEVYDIHDYDQNAEAFRARWDNFCRVTKAQNDVMEANDPFFSDPEMLRKGAHHDGSPFFHQPYHGEPIFVSEYGGIQWNTNGNSGWGYGVAPKNEEEFLARYKALTESLLENPDVSGFCYTQLYDIEQEINGLYTYDREAKFDVSFFHAVNTAKAAIEE